MTRRGARRMRGPSRARGYSLLEVIVAFALLAAALTPLLGALSGAARQVRAAGDAGRAAMHARSLIDQLGVGETLRAQRRAGEWDDGRYRWTLDVVPWRDPGAPADAPQRLDATALMEARLDVAWGDGGPAQRLQLRTLRAVAPSLEAAP